MMMAKAHGPVGSTIPVSCVTWLLSCPAYAGAVVGLEMSSLPPQAPQANAFAERRVGTVRRECTDRILIVGERHLATVLAEYTRHYNGHRPHRSLGQQPPNPPPQVVDLATVRAQRRPILGGLINEYSQPA
jgi:putative transposase